MNFRKQLINFFFLLILTPGSYVHGQKVLGTSDSVYAITAPDIHGNHFRIFSDAWEKYNLRTGQSERVICPGLGSYIRLFDPVENQGRLFLVSIMGGEVFEVQDSKVNRIDKSYNHRMQSASIIFSRNDTIFRHGGYGFWSARDMITFFDFRTRQWELYPAAFSDKLPPAIFGHQYYLSGDSLTVFGGWKVDPAAPLYPVHNNDAWIFDFGNKAWFHIGETLWKNSGYPRTQDKLLNMGNKSFIISYGPLIQVSFDKNELKTGNLSDKTIFWFADKKVFPVLFEGNMYFYRSNTNARGIHEFCVIPESEMVSGCSAPSKWIKKNTSWLFGWILAPLLIFVAAGFYFLRNTGQNKSNIEEHTSTDSVWSINSLELDTAELKLLELFVSRFPENLTVSQLDATLETTQKSRDVQNQRRSQVIRSINLKFMAKNVFVNPVISSKRSEFDGRMMEYFLDPEAHPAISDIIG